MVGAVVAAVPVAALVVVLEAAQEAVLGAAPVALAAPVDAHLLVRRLEARLDLAPEHLAHMAEVTTVAALPCLTPLARGHPRVSSRPLSS